MGPILPQLSVLGKQLGIPSIVMGTVTGILPILFLVAKPIFGYIVDRFRPHRKSIFIALVTSMGLFYAFIYFVPSRIVYNRSLPCNELDTCNGVCISTII